jgi:hypothetical protein
MRKNFRRMGGLVGMGLGALLAPPLIAAPWSAQTPT